MDWDLKLYGIWIPCAGGIVGFDKVIWAARKVLDRDGPSVQFTYHSHDGEQGACSLILSVLGAHMLKSDLANDF